MAKIAFDKFYTPDALASYCVQKALEVIGKDRITEFIEPSAGAGVFLPYLKTTGIPYLAYDIAPEGEGIIQADFLSLPLLYKRGRCFIGNPPFQYTAKIAGKFYRRACQLGDFIAFILPINSLGGTPELSYFDLIFSERLPVTEYSGYLMKCCLNIYERPASGIIRTARAQLGNSRIRFRAFCRGEDRADYIPDGYFLAFCSFGSVGKPSHFIGEYCQEIYVYCDEPDLQRKVLAVTQKDELLPYTIAHSVSTKKLTIDRYWRYLQERIPELREPDTPEQTEKTFDLLTDL